VNHEEAQDDGFGGQVIRCILGTVDLRAAVAMQEGGEGVSQRNSGLGFRRSRAYTILPAA